MGIDPAVDFGSIAVAPSCDPTVFDFIDEDLHRLTDEGLVFCIRNGRLGAHQSVIAFLFKLFFDLSGHVVAGRSGFTGEFEGTDSVEFCGLDKLHQMIKFGISFAGETDDECSANGHIGDAGADFVEDFEVAVTIPRSFHAAKGVWVGMLERDVDVVADFFESGDGFDDFIGEAVRIKVEDSYPFDPIYFRQLVE